ncbi:MAG: hypothetical protein NVS4B6_20410 [Mycobacterium sp.]
MTTARARQSLAVATLAISVLAACSHHDTATPNTAAPAGPPQLNGVSASQLMDSIVKAGLPAPNQRDVTSVKCPKLQCLQAIDTDTVSVLKFPGTGKAELYAGAIRNVYQVEDVVLTFGPTVTGDLKRQYESVVNRAAF